MTSIEKSLEKHPDSLRSEISSMIRARSRDGRLLVVVEGIDDKTIYGKLFDKDKYEVRISSWYPGCGYFVEAAKDLNSEYPTRYIMIKDADFDHLDHRTYDDIPNLFLTDTHDLETMMVTDEFCKQLASQSWGIQDGESFCKEVMTATIHLSYIKWMSETEKRAIKFDGSNCGVGAAYNGTSSISIADWLDKLNKANEGIPGANMPTAEEVKQFENDHPEGAEQLLQLTNGHDIVTAILQKIRAHKKGNVKKGEVTGLLNDSYTRDCYMETALYKSIIAWEIANNRKEKTH